jgi:ketosteroid isomerase-like protein
MTDAEREVMSTIRAMFEAIESKDLSKLAEHYSQDEDLTAFLPTIPFRLDGYSHFWQEMENYKGKRTVSQVQVFQPKIQIYGDVAVATFYSTTRVYVPEKLPPQGESQSPRTYSARTTQVFHKRDGKWVLVHTHISALP